MPRIGLISDTHGRVRPSAVRALRGCAVVLHAGDVGGPGVLDALRALAPVHAVRGNVDDPFQPDLAEHVDLTIAGCRIPLVHGHQWGAPTPERLAGAIDAVPPSALDAVIDATPVWGPDMEALKRLKPGGRLVINAIRKQDADREVLSTLDYPSQLWMEKEIKSAANVTRQDVREFLSLAAEAGIKPEFQEYELKNANLALNELKQGKIRGAKVLRI